MLEQDVPQDAGIAEGLKEVCYAVDCTGKYTLAPSVGWEPKNIANYQAWDQILEELEDVRSQVLQGKLSPLAYFMYRNQMDVALLAQYVGRFKWQVRRHLKPAVFRKLSAKVLERYAALLKVSVAELTSVEAVAADRLVIAGRQTAGEQS